MSRFIDADALRHLVLYFADALLHLVLYFADASNLIGEHEHAKVYNHCIILIDDQKSADVRPNVHGEWLGEYEGEIDGTHHCSVCDGWVVWDDINHAYTYNFCPNCGAKMDLKGETNG